MQLNSIKTKLAITIGVLALIMVAIISVVTNKISRQQIASDQGSLLKQVTLNMSSQLNQDMNARGAEITFLATADRIQDPKVALASKQRILENIKKAYPYYAWIGITDAEGNIIVGTENILVGKSVAKRDWFLLGAQGLHFGDAHDAFLLAKLMPKPKWDDLPLRLVDVSAPIKDADGNLIGVICGHLSLDWAFEARQKMLDQLEQPGVDMLVLNQDGKVLMGTPELPSLQVDLSGLTTVSNTIKNRSPQLNTETWSDGQRYLTTSVRDAGFGQYPGMGWMVVARKPETQAMMPAVKMNELVLIIGGISTLVFGLVLILILRRQLNPLAEVTQAAQQLHEGDWSAAIPKLTGKDEVSVFANALTDLVLSMHEKNTELKLAQRVFDESGQGIIITDAQRIILRVNQSFLRITGYTTDDVLGKTPNILNSGKQDAQFYAKMNNQLAQTGTWQGEVWNRNKDGALYPEWLIINVLKNAQDEITHYIGIFDDMTEKKDFETRLVHLANYDVLTQLPNRHLMQAQTESLINQAKQKQQNLALLFVDLDKFKFINDSLGHPVGDMVLQEVAHRFKREITPAMMLARWGGDEFVVVLPDCDSMQAAEIAKKLIDSLQRPFNIDGSRYHLAMSVGIALYPHNGQTVEHLLRAADTAMYQAKHTGVGGYHFYEANMNDGVERFFKIDNALRDALNHDGEGLSLAFQPQFSICGKKTLSAEALLRWQHPVLGRVSPADFIPVAEDTGQMIKLGEWVIKEAARCYQVMRASGCEIVPISINISAQQLNNVMLANFIHETFQSFSIPTEHIMIEVTESAIMSDENTALATLSALKDFGYRISIDDFGTGYACLSYIQRISPAEIKIDQRFVSEMNESTDSKNIIAFTLGLAKSMSIEVVAEGVETQAQLDALSAMGEMKIQGYLLAKPMPLSDFQEHLKS